MIIQKMTDITLPLDIDSLEIINQTIDNKGNIILEVVSKVSAQLTTPTKNF